MTLKNYIIAWCKTVLSYFKIFRKPLLYFGGFITLIVAWKFVPLLFMLAYTPPPIMVNAEKAVSEQWNKELYAIGTVAAVRSVTVAPEIAGLITKIHFESGQEVEANAPLIQLNDEAEQSDLEQYSAQLALAKLTVERSKKLTKRNVQSQAQLDLSESQVKEADALVNKSKAAIDKKNIRAPFAGILGIRQVNLGQYIAPGQTMVTLTDAKQVYVNFTVAEGNRHLLAVGQKVVIKVDAYPDKTFAGTITTIDPQINQDTRTVPVQATLDNKDLLLSSGMFADLKVILPQNDTVVVVPETAVDFGLYGSSVFIVTPKEADKENSPLVVNRQYVKVGDQQKGRIAIIEGVKENDLVVTAGQLKLNNGAHVAISENKTPAIPDHISNH